MRLAAKAKSIGTGKTSVVEKLHISSMEKGIRNAVEEEHRVKPANSCTKVGRTKPIIEEGSR